MTNTIKHLVCDEQALFGGCQSKSDRDRAIMDIIKENQFSHKHLEGPYRLTVSIEQHKFRMCVYDRHEQVSEILVALQPLRRLIKDYQIICDSYTQFVQTADPAKVEAVDMGRRALHNEGAEALEALLPEAVTMDFETSRKFFYLIYVLQQK